MELIIKLAGEHGLELGEAIEKMIEARMILVEALDEDEDESTITDDDVYDFAASLQEEEALETEYLAAV